LADLISRFNAALQQAYAKCICKEILYEEADVMKVQPFFTSLGLPKPSLEEVNEFSAIYKDAYRRTQRAARTRKRILRS
jgi:hypothetical protein